MKKKLLVLGMVLALTLVWITPIQSEAACSDWIIVSYNDTPYCATPVCHLSIPGQYTEVSGERYCYSEGEVTKEYKTEKIYHGCCDHL